MGGNESKRGGVRRLRALVAGAVFAVVAVGIVAGVGTGTISALGVGSISAICPLGGLESMLGAWAFIPRAAFLLAGALIVGLVFGKAFCSWICPVPHIGDFFRSKKRAHAELSERRDAGARALARYEEKQAQGAAVCTRAADADGADAPDAAEASEASERGANPCAGKEPDAVGVARRTHRRDGLDTRHAVLGGALLSTAVFGFPVFCLICPIGLTFATVVLLMQFVRFNEPSIGLLVFPAIVVVEAVVMRRWCRAICPLGALLSLLGRANRTFRPVVDKRACLRASGVECAACDAACPEHIDPCENLGDRPLAECTRCASCAAACPAHAIHFPALPRGKSYDVGPSRGEGCAKGEREGRKPYSE